MRLLFAIVIFVDMWCFYCGASVVAVLVFVYMLEWTGKKLS